MEALFKACWLGHSECIQVLLAHPSPLEVNGIYSSGVQRHANGLTPLCVAVKSGGPGSPEVVRALLNAGASCTLRSRDGKPPLYYACASNCDGDASRASCVRVLLAAPEGMSVINWGPGERGGGNTALHHAGRSGLVAVCEALIKSGCDTTVLNDYDETAYDWAGNHGQVAVQKLFVRLNVAPSLKMRAVRMRKRIGRRVPKTGEIMQFFPCIPVCAILCCSCFVSSYPPDY